MEPMKYTWWAIDYLLFLVILELEEVPAEEISLCGFGLAPFPFLILFSQFP